eukprot:2817779-Rhodomonas_salina.1
MQYCHGVRFHGHALCGIAHVLSCAMLKGHGHTLCGMRHQQGEGQIVISHLLCNTDTAMVRWALSNALRGMQH